MAYVLVCGRRNREGALEVRLHHQLEVDNMNSDACNVCRQQQLSKNRVRTVEAALVGHSRRTVDAASTRALKVHVHDGAEDRSREAERLDHRVARAAVNHCQTDHLGEILIRLPFSYGQGRHTFF